MTYFSTTISRLIKCLLSHTLDSIMIFSNLKLGSLECIGFPVVLNSREELLFEDIL